MLNSGDQISQYLFQLQTRQQQEQVRLRMQHQQILQQNGGHLTPQLQAFFEQQVHVLQQQHQEQLQQVYQHFPIPQIMGTTAQAQQSNTDFISTLGHGGVSNSSVKSPLTTAQMPQLPQQQHNSIMQATAQNTTPQKRKHESTQKTSTGRKSPDMQSHDDDSDERSSTQSIDEEHEESASEDNAVSSSSSDDESSEEEPLPSVVMPLTTFLSRPPNPMLGRSDVPSKVLTTIFSYLPALPCYLSLQRVCRHWYTHLNNEEWPNVDTLNFSCFDMKNVTQDDIDVIFEKRRGRITKLVFSDTMIDAALQNSISAIIPDQLETLILAYCIIEDMDGFVVSLRSLRSLKHLTIAGNPSPDEDEEASAVKPEHVHRLLHENPNITSLSLEWTAMTDTEIAAVQTWVLEKRPSLKLLITKQPLFISDEEEDEEEDTSDRDDDPDSQSIVLDADDDSGPYAKTRLRTRSSESNARAEARRQRAASRQKAKEESFQQFEAMVQRTDIAPSTATLWDIIVYDTNCDLALIRRLLRYGLSPNLPIDKYKNTVFHLLMGEAQDIIKDWMQLKRELTGFRHKQPEKVISETRAKWDRRKKQLHSDFLLFLNHDANVSLKNTNKKQSAFDIGKDIDAEIEAAKILSQTSRRKRNQQKLLAFYPFDSNYFHDCLETYAQFYSRRRRKRPVKRQRTDQPPQLTYIQVPVINGNIVAHPMSGSPMSAYSAQSTPVYNTITTATHTAQVQQAFVLQPSPPTSNTYTQPAGFPNIVLPSLQQLQAATGTAVAASVPAITPPSDAFLPPIVAPQPPDSVATTDGINATQAPPVVVASSSTTTTTEETAPLQENK